MLLKIQNKDTQSFDNVTIDQAHELELKTSE